MYYPAGLEYDIAKLQAEIVEFEEKLEALQNVVDTLVKKVLEKET